MSGNDRYWRSLEELAEAPDFAALLAQRAPRLAAAAFSAVDRRRFLRLMAASMALGGLAGCGPEEAPRELLPYVEQPEGILPGRSRFYATALPFEGYATGVLVEHQMGRPVKVEGNPDHPASLGAADALLQAAILDLYDPHRAQSITGHGQLQSWEAAVAAITARRGEMLERHGEGFRLLTGNVSSPSLAAAIAVLQQQFPGMQWHQWEPLNRDSEWAAAELAFGRGIDLIPDPARADIIFAIESDLISTAPGHLAHARAFAARRRPDETGGEMSRVYAIESTPSLLGAKADHRLPLSPVEIEAALRYLAAKLGAAPEAWGHQRLEQSAWLDAAAEDLLRHRGRSLVHAGREQPMEVHALVHAVNGALGSFGATLRLIEPVLASPQPRQQSLAALVTDMAAGKVHTLVMLGVNPAYDAPADLDFAAALTRVPFSLSLARYVDETARLCTWHIPAVHEFEEWNDARAFDGTLGIIQPQARPLYGGRAARELLAVLRGETLPDVAAELREFWRQEAQRRGAGDFEAFWTETLRSGRVAESAAPAIAVAPRSDFIARLPPPPGGAAPLHILFRPDPALWDGRFAGNPWLLELPRPFTRLTWDNAALIAPATAKRLGAESEEVVTVTAGGRNLRAPLFVLPGQAPDCITLPLGFGRAAGGTPGIDIGFDAYALRTAKAPWGLDGAAIAKTGERLRLATVQGHDRIAGRDLIHEGKLAEFRDNPHFLGHKEGQPSLYPGFTYDGDAWAMAINLNSCIGCQACVAACQAENNIPVVGKDQVLAGREMHWLRIDRYYSGTPDRPAIAFEPVPCMHCEQAPCEVVCPVQATVHDHQGLNAMVYNRCVGTRFCSNNCPYKVRRFNFFGYAMREDRPAASWNPEVTVRDRGVMEKCTYCVQRIRAAQIDADRENRSVRDGEILTACQQACPTQAIIFGNKNDPDSAVSRRKASPLDYVLLRELNTRPRTSYAAIIRNPNPAIPEESA
jgi:MoCo/4Fe-4S cofactor protein with predicted Tat translocation signal